MTTLSISERPLSEAPWFNGIYARIYEIIAMDGRLPPASEIIVSPKPPAGMPGNVYGAAWRDNGRWRVWFRHVPPSPVAFAHELIHCAVKKGNPGEEELYSYNLSEFIVLLAEQGIRPPANPLLLFDARLTKKELLDMINEFYARYKVKFESLAEYFSFRGVIPLFAELDGATMTVREKPWPDREVVLIALTEILAAAVYERLSLELALHILARLAQRK